MSTVSAAMTYPHEMHTHDAVLRVSTRQELESSAFSYVESLRRQGATDYHRVCTNAEFTGNDEDRINGTHLVHVLKGGTYVSPPFPSSMSLVLVDGIWLGCGIKVSVRNSQITVLDPTLVARDRQTEKTMDELQAQPPHASSETHPDTDAPGRDEADRY